MCKIFFVAEPVQSDPCNPSPCGPNTRCDNGICTCLPDYFGNAQVGCRPECVLNTDCNRDRACVRNKCTDPCSGTCAINAICNVINHIPMCTCPEGFEGNAFVQCNAIRGMKINFIKRNHFSSFYIMKATFLLFTIQFQLH